MRRSSCEAALGRVGWAERSETHHDTRNHMVGFVTLNPPYGLSALLPRRLLNLDQLAGLLLGQRLRDELQGAPLAHQRVEPMNLVGLNQRPREEVVAHTPGDRLGDADEVGIVLDD